ncbi:MAG: hypothetical protein QXK19_05385 [Nitrososphaerota archaeon]
MRKRMWKKITLTILAILILSSAFLLFTFNLSGMQDFIGQLLQEVKQAISTGELEYVKLTIHLTESDLGHSMTYLGNESTISAPLAYTYVTVGGESKLTDNQGKAYFIIPKGNHTLTVLRGGQGRTAWTTQINVVSDGEVSIRFYLFRMEASSIKVYPEPFEGLSRLKIKFILPQYGEYYVGRPTITYYTSWGQLRVFFDGLTIQDGIALEDVWGLVKIDYSKIESGGQTVELVEELRGFPTYVHPRFSFLPIERVEVKERWLS